MLDLHLTTVGGVQINFNLYIALINIICLGERVCHWCEIDIGSPIFMLINKVFY